VSDKITEFLDVFSQAVILSLRDSVFAFSAANDSFVKPGALSILLYHFLSVVS